MSQHLIMMYQLFIMKSTNSSVVTEEEVRQTRDELGKTIGVVALDKQVKEFYMNYQPHFDSCDKLKIAA